ncbi:hypothetical protein [Algoriphagus boritolerans]
MAKHRLTDRKKMDFSNKDFTEIKDLKQILEKIDANPKKIP